MSNPYIGSYKTMPNDALSQLAAYLTKSEDGSQARLMYEAVSLELDARVKRWAAEG